MKRSEMVKIIAQHLVTDNAYYANAEKDADELLTIMENKGILPPEAEFNVEKDFGKDLNFTIVKKERKWESE